MLASFFKGFIFFWKKKKGKRKSPIKGFVSIRGLPSRDPANLSSVQGKVYMYAYHHLQFPKHSSVYGIVSYNDPPMNLQVRSSKCSAKTVAISNSWLPIIKLHAHYFHIDCSTQMILYFEILQTIGVWDIFCLHNRDIALLRDTKLMTIVEKGGTGWSWEASDAKVWERLSKLKKVNIV